METVIMRKFIAPLFVALLSVAPAGAAFAATTTAPAPMASAQSDQKVSGTVKEINLTARSLLLADGSRYFLPTSFKAPQNLKAGEKVTVHWKMNGSAHDVTAIDIG
jgi:hypothetical protein